MKLHYLAPLIGEWCTVCKAYTEHTNGSTILQTISLDVPVSSTQCNRCTWVTRYV